MGYDDNTPLTGVTGGGLPAEIWRETMVRVHDGLPVRPLPLMEPKGATRVVEGTSRGGGLESTLDRMLRDIFGGRGGGGQPTRAADR